LFERIGSLAATALMVCLVPAGADDKEKAERLVVFKMTVPDGQWIKATSTDGGVTRVTFAGTSLSVSPHIVDRDRSVVAFSVFNPSKSETVPVDVVQHAKGNPPAITQTKPSVELEVIKLRDKKPTSTTGSLTVDEDSQGCHASSSSILASDGDVHAMGKCCVTCGTTTVCGCAVIMECGDCCADPCCP
jgi:hypothetical protein